MGQPWLSVVIPTFNGERFIADALQSVAAQGEGELKDVEVLVVDDGSTDETLRIVEAARARLPLTVIADGRVGNWTANTNRGFARATGTFLCTLHQDDVWLPGRLRRLRELSQRVPDARFLLHPARYIDDRGKTVGTWGCPFAPSQTRVTRERFIERLLIQNFISMPAPLFSRELVEQVGGLKEDLWYTADWDFWLRLAEQSPVIGYCGEPLAGYRLHPQALTNQRSQDSAEFRQELTRALEAHLAAWEKTQPRSARAVRDAAYFSIEANVYLAARAHGAASGGARVARQFLALGPAGWQRYVRDSRIADRVVARVRALGPGLTR